MNRTKIEWADYTWNPVTGCHGFGCEVRRRGKCYAMKMAQRLRGRYGYPLDQPFKPTFHEDRLYEPLSLKKPSKIFTVSMGDLFGVPYEMTQKVLDVIERAPWHTFQLLTKLAKNATDFDYPKNVWLGVTVNIQKDIWRIDRLLQTDARIKFVSFEPLYESIQAPLQGIDWIIIGAQTNPPTHPVTYWVLDLIENADYFGIPVFLKPNLNWPYKREEFPE